MTVRYDWKDIADWDRQHWWDREEEYRRKVEADKQRRYEKALADWQALGWWQRRRRPMPQNPPMNWGYGDYFHDDGSRHNTREITPSDLGIYPLYWVQEREMVEGDL